MHDKEGNYMKHMRSMTAALAAVLLCGCLTGCGAGMTQQAKNMTAHMKPQLASGMTPDETFEKAQTAFALHLMQEAVKRDGNCGAGYASMAKV